tara:strand:- start:2749 stop:3669 length:921 start_codon:yes stop_codon:yes gene_type:complete
VFKKSSSVCYICKKNKFKKELITNDIYGDSTKKKSFYRCTNCEIIFQKPYFTKKQELKFYQKEFEKFMSKRAGSEAGWQNALNHIKSNKKTYERRLGFLKKSLKKKQNILEIGCSSGFMLFPLIKKKMNCYGIEPSLVFFNFLKKKKIKVFKSMENLKTKYPNKKFDIIMHFFVLEHIADPKKFFKEQIKLLKKNGKIILEVPCYSDALYKLYKIKSFEKFYWSIVHPWYFNMKSLKILLDQLNINYKLRYHQRYSLANHLTWATKGTPGSSKNLEKVLGGKINNMYKSTLEKSGFADTIIAEITK